jgi:hypothetical protein
MKSTARAAVEMDLINSYHKYLKGNSVQKYTLEQCVEDYKISMLSHLSHILA